MAEEKKEPWLNYLALTTVILAVCATLSTLKGGAFSTRSVVAQAQASDQWAYYQAKSIKGYIYDIQREKLELEARAMKSGGSRSMVGEYEKKIAAYKEKTERYDKEKEEIKQKAEDLEKQRNDASKHSGAFGLAAMFLQIAILLSSIAALMRKKPFWFIGLAAGCVGLLYFFNGFFLFMK
jgi:DNA repair exonuclease SbcCD ATPase subunit